MSIFSRFNTYFSFSRTLVWGGLLCSSLSSAQVATNRYGQYLTKDQCALRDSSRLAQIVSLEKMEESTKKYIYQPSGKLLVDSSLFVIRRIELPDKQYLIINVPKQKRAAPVMIFIHGGAWMGGSPERYAEECRYLCSVGIAAVRVSYPLIPDGGNIHKVLSSLHKAIEQLNVKARVLNINPSRIGFCGDSAGAYLSALMAFSTPKCRAWIGISGTYDLTILPPVGNFPSDKNLKDFFGTDIRQDLKSFSPLYRLPPKAPATLLLHGTGDLIIAPRRSQELYDRLKRNTQNQVQMHLSELYSHAFSIRGYSDYYETCVQQIAAFAVEHL